MRTIFAWLPMRTAKRWVWLQRVIVCVERSEYTFVGFSYGEAHLLKLAGNSFVKFCHGISMSYRTFNTNHIGNKKQNIRIFSPNAFKVVCYQRSYYTREELMFARLSNMKHRFRSIRFKRKSDEPI